MYNPVGTRVHYVVLSEQPTGSLWSVDRLVTCTLTPDCCFCSSWYIQHWQITACILSTTFMCSVQLFRTLTVDGSSCGCCFSLLYRGGCAKLSKEINDERRGIDGWPAVRQHSRQTRFLTVSYTSCACHLSLQASNSQSP